MKRVLLDTNIYGLLAVDNDFHTIHGIIENNKGVLRVYGFSLIRKELKQAPHKVIRGVNVRAELLRSYASFVSKEYEMSPLFEEIAEDYFQTYHEQGGTYSRQEMFSDFLIVACASVKEIPVVVSEDNHILASELAIKAYILVNKRRSVSKPTFIRYKEFKEILLRTGSDPLINSSQKFGIFLSFFQVLPRILFFVHASLKAKLIYKDFVVK